MISTMYSSPMRGASLNWSKTLKMIGSLGIRASSPGGGTSAPTGNNNLMKISSSRKISWNSKFFSTYLTFRIFQCWPYVSFRHDVCPSWFFRQLANRKVRNVLLMILPPLCKWKLDLFLRNPVLRIGDLECRRWKWHLDLFCCLILVSLPEKKENIRLD